MTVIQMFRVAVKFMGTSFLCFSLSSLLQVKIAFNDVHDPEDRITIFFNHYSFSSFKDFFLCKILYARELLITSNKLDMGLPCLQAMINSNFRSYCGSIA